VAGKAMLYPALIRLKVFSDALRPDQNTASLQTKTHLPHQFKNPDTKRLVGALRSGSKAAGKAMLYPALIRLKVFSDALRPYEKTASLKTEGRHFAQYYFSQ